MDKWDALILGGPLHPSVARALGVSFGSALPGEIRVGDTVEVLYNGYYAQGHWNRTRTVEEARVESSVFELYYLKAGDRFVVDAVEHGGTSDEWVLGTLLVPPDDDRMVRGSGRTGCGPSWLRVVDRAAKKFAAEGLHPSVRAVLDRTVAEGAYQRKLEVSD